MNIDIEWFRVLEGARSRLRGAVPAVGILAAAFLILGALAPETLAAQQTNPAATSPQMRHFWHVFAAYAIAWLLLFGWVVSIVRRLGRVEGKLES